jgi:two-component system, OmpR family, copper resistance phosphate regulon response regulator CusR
MNEKNRVLIVEDDQRIAQNISRGLQEKGFDTDIAYDGMIGNKLSAANEYDLIILDINLPVMNGYEVCKNIRQRNPNIPILMLTALGETEDKIEGFSVGADDYIVKPFDFRELLARINVFLKRSHPEITPMASVQRIADLEINSAARTVNRAGHSIDLTPKEFSLLEYLVQHRGRTISKTELSEKVWESSIDTNTNVVEVYINFLRKKIDRDFETKLIHTKSGMGYILKEDS